ncbi:phosphotransferase family protein [Micromonosporaceae bacterium Da 78-11]
MSDVREIIATALPGYRVSSVRPLGAGLDNEAFEVNGDLVIRFRRRDPAGVEREARLLRLIAAVSPLPVPEPLIVDGARGCLGYRLLPGVALADLPPPGTAVPGALGGFLAALHAVPAARVAGLVDTDPAAPADWLDETNTHWVAIRGSVPENDHPAIDRFLAEPAPRPAPHLVFSHQDLGAEHVLIDPATEAITGIIDWTDAAVADPAVDFGRLLSGLGPGGLAAALRAYDRAAVTATPEDRTAVRERALFYARCVLIEDLALGLPAYAPRNLAMLPRLF